MYRQISLALVLMFATSVSHARPYFRLLDVRHPVIGVGFHIPPKNLTKTYGVTDIALITHSPKDGTIIPKSLQKYVPPTAWVPLHIGFGGNLRSEAIISGGSSANLSPAVAAFLMKSVNKSSKPWLLAIKKGLQGNEKLAIRMGGSLAGTIVKGGVFQSAKQAFPGQGLFEIIGNAAVLNFGLAWKL